MNTAEQTVSEIQNPVNFTPRQLHNFWSKVDKNGTIPSHMPHLGQCWIWTGGKSGDYGMARFFKTRDRAHRISFRIHKGMIPTGICICHACDNPICVNPSHLWRGTKGDNNHDKSKKGRGNQPRGANHYSTMFPERRPRGNQLRNAKLNPEKVILIRDYRRRGITYKRIAKELKISASLVYVVASGKGWKHVVD